MHVLVYVGPAPSRETVIETSRQIVQRIATSVTLVTTAKREELLEDARARLEPPAAVPVTTIALPGSAQTAILQAAQQADFDLAILGRLHKRVGRLLPGPHSKAIARRLEPSVLRIHGVARPIRRILLASGGDAHTFASASMASRIALALGASVTLLHVASQQSLYFLPPGQRTPQAVLEQENDVTGLLNQVAAQLTANDIVVQMKARVGPVIEEILSEIRVGGYDLLVVGEHRITSALDRILLEDLTGELLDVTPIPTLVVKSQS